MNKRNGRLTAKIGVKNLFWLLRVPPTASCRQAHALLVTPTMVFKDGKILLVTGCPARRSSTPLVLLIFFQRDRFSDAGRAGRRGNARAITSGCPTAQHERYGLSADTDALMKGRATR